MMGKTHITVGIAASFIACRPRTMGQCFAAILGGAAGGILCDIECKSDRRCRDALYSRVIVFGLFAALLALDFMYGLGICRRIASRDATLLLAGGGILLLTCMKGRWSEHRTFTHSILYVILIALGFYLIDPYWRTPLLAGGFSHLALDLFNKRPIQWLYPFRQKICLRFCYANKAANAALMWLGLAADLALIGGWLYINAGRILA